MARLGRATAVLVSCALAAGPGDAGGWLVVHEWGTFTTVAGHDGVPIAWSPLEGPTDLPRFVQVASPKGRLRGTVRMETPVIYFYTDLEMMASVRVDFPGGMLTELYPEAVLAGRSATWEGLRLLPGTDATLPREDAPSHYYAARATDAALVAGRGSQRERFLFYRGVGSFQLPIEAGLEGDAVRVRCRTDMVAEAIVFESRDGKVGHQVVDLGEGGALVARPVLAGSAGALWQDLQRLLAAQGLYELEAQAMLRTWEDSWIEEGLRVFYVVPRRITDEVLPLEVAPEPAELVRVLVGRAEILTPEAVEAVERALSASVPGPLRLGRFAEPTLRQVLARTADRRVEARIRKLIPG